MLSRIVVPVPGASEKHVHNYFFNCFISNRCKYSKHKAATIMAITWDLCIRVSNRTPMTNEQRLSKKRLSK